MIRSAICSGVSRCATCSACLNRWRSGRWNACRSAVRATRWIWTLLSLSAMAVRKGSLKGHNPRKHGRPSHHPLLAVLAEAHLLLHGWLRSGNCGPARGVVEFLEEALALWGQRQKIRLVRADSGFFDDQLLSFLEQRR